ncbi:MAG: SDR family oxidoreductase [Polyangiaceae bacterium]|nr:SDR family oxidoreductase [Polyangiaceae bacterium]
MLSGKRALVTGGAGGIGRAIARALRDAGAEVIVTGRDPGALTRLADELGVATRELDLTDRAAIAALGAALGVVDVLVNNAGVAESAPLARTSDATWDAALAVNVTAPFALCRALMPPMMARGWGRVINVASNAGLVGYAYTSAYVASKHALVGLTRALAKEAGASGVTVNAVCPGFVDTPMTARSAANIADKTRGTEDEARARLASLTPQRRLFSPDEVAALVLTLASPASAGISGAAIPLDGGQTA